jgi:hypothetical protein
MVRRYLAVVALLALVLLSGCFNPFGGISDEQLCEDATYDMSPDADATYTIETNDTYRAVYNVSGTKTLELYQTDGLGTENPLQISAVTFRAADGTTYGCDEIEVETTRHRTIVTLPENNGTFAYTAETRAKRFRTRTFVDGSHEVVLPADRDVDNPVFGNVRPGGHERTVEDGRVHLRWEQMQSDRVVVQYYMERDVAILFGFAGIAAIAAAAGLVYYYRQVKRLEKRREAAGLDVDVEDDDRDPPPGMG